MSPSSTASTFTASRRIGRRLLGSPLVSALTTPHPVDRYLELVRPAWTVAEARAKVTSVRHQTPDSVTLTLRPNSRWDGFKAGQFVQLTVEIDGVQHRRCYSPAGSATDRSAPLELTIRVHPEGRVSRHLKQVAAPGMVVGLEQAGGDFVLPDRRPERLLLVSGGSGITPVLSMLRTLCAEGHEGDVTFLHYARGPEEMLYGTELRELAAAHPNINLAISYTRSPDGDLAGHFKPSHLLETGSAHAEAETFVCGPTALIEAVQATLALEDLEQRLHVEHFVPPAPAVVLGDAEGTIRFRSSGLEAANDGAPLLDQAEAAGVNPASGCRMGICHSCSCRKVSGGVRNTRTGEVSTASDEEIQICISVPVGDVELEL